MGKTLQHKSDVGGVILNVRTASDAIAATALPMCRRWLSSTSTPLSYDPQG
jgi:acyl-CoA synthetase (NDP forming)